MKQLKPLLDAFLQNSKKLAIKILAPIKAQLTSCRECQNSVRFLEDTCQHCGAYAPVKVPWTVSVTLAVTCALMLCVISACSM